MVVNSTKNANSMLKNINSIEIRSLEKSGNRFVELPIIQGSGKISIESTKEASGRLTTITIEAKLRRYIDYIAKPLSIHVQWRDDDFEKVVPHDPIQKVIFGDEFLPAHFEYEDDEVFTISLKYQTSLSFMEMCEINEQSFLRGH